MADQRQALVGWRTAAIVLASVCLVLLAVLQRPRAEPPLPQPPVVALPTPTPTTLPPRLDLEPVDFADLAGWAEDDLEGFKEAFAASCSVFRRRDAQRRLSEPSPAGNYGDWRPLCEAVAGATSGELRGVLETLATPWRMSNRGDAEAFFTGYYEPTLRGSRRRGGPYRYPLYRRPPDLVGVDLGAFREDLKGRRIAGRLEGRALVPFADRGAVDAGALAGRGLELVWVDDPIASFFLHVQGSGRVELDDGSVLRVGYADQNGHPYVAIGRELIERGELAVEEVSLQSIRSWLLTHPDAAPELMARNPSYVFFRQLDGPGPVGSQGVVLTPRRSLAVDRSFLPLGVPLWVETTQPAPAAPETTFAADPVTRTARRRPARPEAAPWRHLLVAQDTGGAIRGPLRGDIFWGPGRSAEEIAGRLRHPGRMFLLLPRGVMPDLAFRLAGPLD